MVLCRWRAQPLKVVTTVLAVATLEEADQLRGLASEDRILVMGALPPPLAPAAAASGFAFTVSSLEFARALDDQGGVVPVHLKIDTGMGRFGCAPEEAPALASFIEKAPGLRLAGTMTHFASADSDEAMTRNQYDRFIGALGAFNVDPGIRHACNSAGRPAFSGVRVGRRPFRHRPLRVRVAGPQARPGISICRDPRQNSGSGGHRGLWGNVACHI